MNSVDVLGLTGLTKLTDLTAGSRDVQIGLVDGPVAVDHAVLDASRLRLIGNPDACQGASRSAFEHGTFVAGILGAKRNSRTPGLCPGCTILIRPVFCAAAVEVGVSPIATPDELAAAILECIGAGARILNLSLALTNLTQKRESSLDRALDQAAKLGVVVVAAAGNQGTVGSSYITRHPWAIPVAACDNVGRPMGFNNLGTSLGRRGLCAPGDKVAGLGPGGPLVKGSGTSVAVAFVTGAVALLWSLFPDSSAGQIRQAVTQGAGASRRSITPPLLNGWAAYEFLIKGRARLAGDFSRVNSSRSSLAGRDLSGLISQPR